MKRVLRRLAACMALLHPGVGWGQSPPAHEPRAADKSRSVPDFRSAFADYRRFDPDMPLVDWRAANEEVKNAGGHVGLMRAQGAGGDRPHAEHRTVTPPPKPPKGHH